MILNDSDENLIDIEIWYFLLISHDGVSMGLEKDICILADVVRT